MKTATKSTLAAIIAVLAASAAPAWADGGHGHWKKHGWKHGHYVGRPYYRDEVVVIREPRYVYAEPRYVYPEPAYVYAPRRPALVIGVSIPPLVVPF